MQEKNKGMATSNKPKRRKKETFTISYRVDGVTLARLERDATPYGISVHEYARQQLFEKLESQAEARLLEESQATRQSVEGLRSDVAATLEVILMNTTKAATPEEQERIRNWIGQYLRRGE